MITILVIPFSAAQGNCAADWSASADVLPRRCPVCQQDSIIGHGRRLKQAHDEQHDWIAIRRGICHLCRKTFTILPPFSPAYSHYSLMARSQALRRRFLEGRSFEDSAPVVKHPDRMADPSTLRRWFRSLDTSCPPFTYLHRTLYAIHQYLDRGSILTHGLLRLDWPTLFPFLSQFWPLRL